MFSLDVATVKQCYLSGEEIHIGDRVEYAGSPATILLVIDREEWPANQPVESRDWWRAEHKSGFLLSAYGRLFLSEADEDLTFVSRGAAPDDI